MPQDMHRAFCILFMTCWSDIVTPLQLAVIAAGAQTTGQAPDIWAILDALYMPHVVRPPAGPHLCSHRLMHACELN